MGDLTGDITILGNPSLEVDYTFRVFEANNVEDILVIYSLPGLRLMVAYKVFRYPPQLE
jgi:hypothetical protein